MTGTDVPPQDDRHGAAPAPPFSLEEQRRRARRMGVVNHFTRPLLSLPFRTPMSKRLMLVEIIGRKSGRVYKQPLSYVRDGDALLTPGGGNWKLNLREDTANRIHLEGKWVAAVPELVRDPTSVTELLHRMHAASPGSARWIPVLDQDGSVDQDKLAPALGHGFLIVRWRPQP
jgi:F420H(2)-dependent quinone reductase